MEEYGLLAIVQYAHGHCGFEMELSQHLVLDGIGGDEVDHLNCSFLPHPVYACNSLFQHSRVPWKVQIYQYGCSLKIQPNTTSVS